MWSGLPAEMEVFNLFSGVIRQEGLPRIDGHRQLQAMVPDMRITLPAVGSNNRRALRGGQGGPGGVALAGQSSAVLHELKVISSNRTRYRPAAEKRAVDTRADLLNQEYLSKARVADRRQGVLEGEVGRVEAKLVSLGKVRGLVAGQFGEVSEDTHLLVSAMATSRVRVAGPTRGRRGHMRTEEGERAVAISSIRRRLGVMTVRCQASSLLGRLESLGPGGGAATGRRWQALELERNFRRETRAHYLATKQGWQIMRSGFAKMD